MTTRSIYVRRAAVGFAVMVTASLAGVRGQVAAPGIAIDNDDIGGTVTGLRGPEGGSVGHC